jgi:hypothetical protein
MMEDWSPHRFYRTMRHIFRPNRTDPDGLVEIPFWLYRPLSYIEFNGCAELFINARHKEHLSRLALAQQGKQPRPPASERWPDLDVPQEEFWKYEVPLGNLYFAQTSRSQSRARREVRQLAQRGSIRVRKLLSNAVKNTPQAKRQLSGEEIVRLVEYRSERQFMWAFLRHESGLSREELKNPESVKNAAHQLADAYRYLHLTWEVVNEGLSYPHQADRDTAEEFEISERSVRSLISKFHTRST